MSGGACGDKLATLVSYMGLYSDACLCDSNGTTLLGWSHCDDNFDRCSTFCQSSKGFAAGPGFSMHAFPFDRRDWQQLRDAGSETSD